MSLGDLVAADRRATAVWRERALREDRDVGRAGADVDQAHAELALVVGQHRARRGDRGRQQLVDLRGRSG